MLFDTIYVSSKYVSGFVMVHIKIFLLFLLRIIQLDLCNHLQVLQLIEIRSFFLKYFLLSFLCIIFMHSFQQDLRYSSDNIVIVKQQLSFLQMYLNHIKIISETSEITSLPSSVMVKMTQLGICRYTT